LGLVIALGLAFGPAGSALADINSNTAPVTITLTENGVFEVSIVGANLSGPISANAGGVSTGDLCISYVDTKTFRPQFHTQLSATDFASNTLVVPPSRVNAGQPYKISASNFEITRVFDVFQGRWSSWALANLGYAIGDIGNSSNGNDDNYSSGESSEGPTFYNGTPQSADGCGGAVTGTSNIKNHDWTGVVNRALSGNPIVGFGFAGPGTAGPFPPTFGSVEVIKTKLTIPAGQPADTYTSTLTVTVTFTGGL
jgi:hypothetical protein